MKTVVLLINCFPSMVYRHLSTKWWQLLVPGTVSPNSYQSFRFSLTATISSLLIARKVIPSMDDLQYSLTAWNIRDWIINRSLETDTKILHLTVPTSLLQADFLWLVAKKVEVASCTAQHNRHWNSQYLWSGANSLWCKAWLFSAAHEQNRCHAPDHHQWCTLRRDKVHHPSWHLSPQDAQYTRPCSSVILGFHPPQHSDNFQQRPREWYTQSLLFLLSPVRDAELGSLWWRSSCKIVNTVHQQFNEIVHISCVYP